MDTDKRIKQLLLEKSNSFDINYNRILIKVVDNYIKFTKAQTVMIQHRTDLLTTDSFLLDLELEKLKRELKEQKEKYPVINFISKIRYKIKYAFNNL